MELAHNLKMKHKVILAFLALTTLMSALLAAISLGALESSAREEVLERSRFFSRYLGSSLEGKIERACKVLESLAASPGLSGLPPEQARMVLDDCRLWSGKVFSDVWYFSPEGVCAATSPEDPRSFGKRHADIPGLKEPVAEMTRTGATVVVGRFREAKKGQKALLLTPVGNVGGFLSALVDFSDWRTFSRAGARAGYAALVDAEGTIVSIDPDPNNLRGSSYRIAIEGVTRLPAELTTGVPGVEPAGDDSNVLTVRGTTTVTGASELVCVAPIQRLGFRLLIGIPESYAFRRVDELKTRITMLTALCWIAAAFLGAWFASRIARPLAMLRRHVEDLERGQFPEELQWQYGDEIGILGRAINAMAKTLRRERVMKDVFGFKSEDEGDT
ncbi:MAG: HAMP domain-containing protein [Candidatus Wallbacteria bacterium]|nr:HAMP domain-containing protein [Candidatus Wallbacteria bacterium]